MNLTQAKWSAIAATLVALPLALLELINRREFHEGFPFALFIMLWLMPFAFALLSALPLAALRKGLSLSPTQILIRLPAMLYLALAWFNLVKDQMPCFLGVPNCD